MSEELYNSNDYCSLAEQYEELKKENAELTADKAHLMNLFMESSEYIFDVVSNMKINDLERKCKVLEADYVISNRELLILQSRIAELEEKQRWIPVSERLPEAERKEFCPNCEAETPCTHEAELFVCDICGEDFAKYIVSRSANVSDVSTTQDVLTDVKTPRSIENTNPDYYKDELYLDEDFRMLSKTYPADVSAIGVTTLIDYVEALEAELARLQAERRWIPVSERLPEIEEGDSKEYDVVITYPRESSVTVAWWAYNIFDKTHQRRIWIEDQGEFGHEDITKYVTHWRERPTPPEVK